MSDTLTNDKAMTEPTPGLGAGGVVPDHQRAKDFILYRRAILQGWPVEERHRHIAIESAVNTFYDENASHKDRHAARTFLLEVDKVRLAAMRDMESSERGPSQTNIQVNVTNTSEMTTDELRDRIGALRSGVRSEDA